MDRDALIRNSLDAINSVIDSFHENPYAFLYERDIQCALFSELRERINKHVNVPGKRGNKYTLHLVYSEYLDNIDIVCLDPVAIRKRDASSFKQHKGFDTYIYNLPIFLGIELKYIWMGHNGGFNILERDCLKLTKRSKHLRNIANWIVLGFIQREEEAVPFVKGAKNGCRLALLNSIEKLNDIYIITTDKIFAAYLESGQYEQEGQMRYP